MPMPPTPMKCTFACANRVLTGLQLSSDGSHLASDSKERIWLVQPSRRTNRQNQPSLSAKPATVVRQFSQPHLETESDAHLLQSGR